MADIRINSLPTTASASSSDDFLALDGATNGTRKLNAYSPTFGGNLTVSGTGTTGGNLSVRNALGYATGIHTGTTSDSTQQLLLSSNAAYNHAYISKGSTTLGIGFSSDNGSFVADDSITITAATKLVTLAGNLTVSGVTTSAGISNSGALTFTAAIGQVAGSIAKNATYGLTYYGVTGSSNDNTMLNASGAVVLSNPAGTTNATLTGNLTVSGTGTSSFGGKIQSSAATATGYNQLYDTTGITTGRGAFAITSTGAGLAFGIEASVGGTSFANSTAYASYFGTTTATPVHFVANASIGATLTSGGNLLIGTTTDSGNGKLQLATHTTSAGGIGFGTDTSLYRYGAGFLAIDHAGAANSGLFLYENGVIKSEVTSYGGVTYVGSKAGNTIIQSNNTTALTLDTSQRAIFSPARAASNLAVKIISSGAATNADRNFLLFGHNTAANAAVISQIDNTTTGAMSLILASGTDSTGAAAALTLDSSQNATFAGTIALTGSSAGQVATWNSSNANGIYHTYLTNGTAIGDIGSAAQAVSGSASDFGITSRAGKLVLGTSSAARVTIDTSGNLIASVTGTAPTLGTNSTMTFELTSNTSLTIKVRGTDGTTRSVALTLA